MRIKTKFKFTHFGVTFRTNKRGSLSIEAFLEKEPIRPTTDEFFWSMRYKELYKLFQKEDVLDYFVSLKQETESRETFGDTRMILYWCKVVIDFFSDRYYKRTQDAYRRRYYKENEFLKQYTYDDYINRFIPGNWKYRKALYDFSDSVYKPYYSEKWYELIGGALIKNYNINIEHFNKLSKDDFNKELNNFFEKYPFFDEINDLNKTNCEYPGYYVLVLDRYKQVYIGMGKNIKKRILDHFKKIVKYDRRIFGKIEESKISIDSFGCFDITRIFVHKDNLVGWGFTHEDELISAFDNRYVTNRIRGDELPAGLMGEKPKKISR